MMSRKYVSITPLDKKYHKNGGATRGLPKWSVPILILLLPKHVELRTFDVIRRISVGTITPAYFSRSCVWELPPWLHPLFIFTYFLLLILFHSISALSSNLSAHSVPINHYAWNIIKCCLVKCVNNAARQKVLQKGRCNTRTSQDTSTHLNPTPTQARLTSDVWWDLLH